MSKTISFVAKDELAEYLEAEAERRMATISSTAQMLLAEKIREDQRRAAEATRKGGSGSGSTGSAGADSDGGSVTEWGEEVFGDTEAHETMPAFQKRPDAWYQPDSEKHDYAVEVPEGADVYDAGETRYFKTCNGAAKALNRWYE